MLASILSGLSKVFAGQRSKQVGFNEADFDPWAWSLDYEIVYARGAQGHCHY